MIAEVARAAALVLAGMFLWAASVKVRRPTVTATSFRSLGLPAAGALAWVVPLAELAVAVALLVAPSAGGWAAMALLGGFTLFVARALHRGVAAPCACFGSSSDQPISSVELVRNALLLSLAIVATAAPAAVGVRLPSLAGFLIVAAAVGGGRVFLAAIDQRRTTARLSPSAPQAGP